MKNTRVAGVLLHPTSLPSKYGIGDLGEDAYKFVDFLHASKQTLWQTLPLGPTGYGNSPYSALSAFAGNHLMISIDKLVNDGLLFESDIQIPHFESKYRVDFELVANFKMQLFEKAYQKFKTVPGDLKRDYNKFCVENSDWLDDYALFMAAKKEHGGKHWTEWEKELVKRENLDYYMEKYAEGVGFHKFLQFIFFRQWLELKNYANSKNIKIIGDIPIFVAYDSADVWANKKYFTIDEEGKQITVAGVPPDYFSETGQLWGNPLYQWEEHIKDNFTWWKQRFHSLLKITDIVRIDHFRGFEAFWEIPAGSPNAIKGKWVKAPGKELFQAIKDEFGDLPIIAEDLGVITPEVEELRDSFGLPGMKVLQFAFGKDGEKKFLPHNYIQNCVVYTGTHDNDTTKGFFDSEREKGSDVFEHAKKYLNFSGENIVYELIRVAYASVANIVLIPMQDILNLGTEHRMNFPGKADGNWAWRFTWYQVPNNLNHKLADMVELYERYPEDKKKEESITEDKK
ncbi:MAG TPA: 4-alpha-glucanotransferase [Ignavibacteriales bacterium]|nr:4-alpha-glucanotransferase [Ignavibacteriales bacterium]HOL80891.1 4-alpha-glucanotransferase [Ignavibacteriales bacterium]HOM65915.1 4-alpha-glucanotransferase [Ignavibacteriales bacterium]HPD67975.1 4-alpha-glucanotransferase [Ignavibacteriales bacterium]HPP33326.1 4-alpha-glucanotransferase [Ignavibacteriales bacterium]